MHNEIYKTIADALEVDDLKPETVLGELENWDSLTILSIIASLDAMHGVNLRAADLRSARTAGDLVALVLTKQSK